MYLLVWRISNESKTVLRPDSISNGKGQMRNITTPLYELDLKLYGKRIKWDFLNSNLNSFGFKIFSFHVVFGCWCVANVVSLHIPVAFFTFSFLSWWCKCFANIVSALIYVCYCDTPLPLLRCLVQLVSSTELVSFTKAMGLTQLQSFRKLVSFF